MSLSVYEKDAQEVPALVRKRLQTSCANYYVACQALDGPSLQTCRFNGRSDDGQQIDGLLFMGPMSPEVAALLDDLDGVTSQYCEHVARWQALERRIREQ